MFFFELPHRKWRFLFTLMVAKQLMLSMNKTDLSLKLVGLQRISTPKSENHASIKGTDVVTCVEASCSKTNLSLTRWLLSMITAIILTYIAFSFLLKQSSWKGYKQQLFIAGGCYWQKCYQSSREQMPPLPPWEREEGGYQFWGILRHWGF